MRAVIEGLQRCDGIAQISAVDDVGVGRSSGSAGRGQLMGSGGIVST